jgi:hypothetical protein
LLDTLLCSKAVIVLESSRLSFVCLRQRLKNLA